MRGHGQTSGDYIDKKRRIGYTVGMNDGTGETTLRYATSGTCSDSLAITVRDGVIAEASFEGGCQGNLEGLARLVVGLSPAEAASRLRGIRCGSKDTSCPDQLARALESML